MFPGHFSRPILSRFLNFLGFITIFRQIHSGRLGPRPAPNDWAGMAKRWVQGRQIWSCKPPPKYKQPVPSEWVSIFFPFTLRRHHVIPCPLLDLWRFLNFQIHTNPRFVLRVYLPRWWMFSWMDRHSMFWGPIRSLSTDPLLFASIRHLVPSFAIWLPVTFSCD